MQQGSWIRKSKKRKRERDGPAEMLPDRYGKGERGKEEEEEGKEGGEKRERRRNGKKEGGREWSKRGERQ